MLMRQPVTGRKALAQRIFNRTAQQQIVPAPVGGWNKRDPLAQMDPRDAIELINWFPGTSDVRMRRGNEAYATGLPNAVETLAEWAYGGNRKMIAFSAGRVYDVTNPGPVGPPLASDKSNNRWQYVNFGTVGGNYVVAVNGADAPIKFDGSTVSDIGSGPESAITGSGLDPSRLIGVNLFKSRLFFIERNSMKFWYLPPLAIGGTAEEFDLASRCALGGQLLAMATWTIDGGSGVDDLAVFLTSEGEVVVYQGDDPGTADSWSEVGRYVLPKPIGRRCFMKYGGDILVITENGIFPLSQALITSGATPRVAISDKIRDAFTKAAQMYRNSFGWQGIQYSRGSQLIFNIPTAENFTADQYVMNSQTGAWCRYTGINASCWLESDGTLYCGGRGVVYKSDSGYSDDGEAIEADMQPAFYDFGTPEKKQWTICRPTFEAGGTVIPATVLNVDYQINDATGVVVSPDTSGTYWDQGYWDVSAWAGESQARLQWQGIAGVGTRASLRMKVKSTSQTIALISTQFIFKLCGNPV